MSGFRKVARFGSVAMLAGSLAACSGTLGNVLGGVLGGLGGSNQVSGTVQSVDTRSQQVYVVQSNGQSVALSYDNTTNVVFNNTNYPITSLENGDQVTAQVQQQQNGTYYTNLITVTQSVSGSTTGASGNVQSMEGTVQQVDRANGWFTMNTNNNGFLTVTMPYNARSADVTRFNSLRNGDYVRIYGVFLNNSRVELRQFY